MKHRLKYTLTCIMVMVICIANTAYAASISKTSAEMKVGDTITITAYGVSGTWVSNMPNIAIVEDGKITAISAGSAVISLVTESGESYDCVVNVRGNTVSNPTIGQYVVSSADKNDNVVTPGYYNLITEAGKFGSYTILTENVSTGIRENATVFGNTLIELKEGESIKVNGCRIESINDSILNTASAGEFEVGRHIQSGDYIVETDNSSVGRVVVYSDISKTNMITCYDIAQSTPFLVSLTDGQCISLINCKLVG